MHKDKANDKGGLTDSCEHSDGNTGKWNAQDDVVTYEWAPPRLASDILFLLEGQALIGFDRTQNIYFVLDVLIEFDRAGLQCPKWVSAELARRFAKHIKLPAPDLLSLQLGVSARGSGSTNSYRKYVLFRNRIRAISDMYKLIQLFDISLIGAARAMTKKHRLTIDPKTLLKYFREYYGNPNKFRFRNLTISFGDDLDSIRQEFLSECPRDARRIIKEKMRPKT